MDKTLKSAAYKRLIGLLVAARNRADLQQQKVADALGEHQSFVAKYEGGERRLDILEFIAIARALRADPVKLLKQFIAVEDRIAAEKAENSQKTGKRKV